MPGRLIIEPERPPTLDLIGELTPAWRRLGSTQPGEATVDQWVPAEEESERTVHGDLFDLNEPVTVLRALTRNRINRLGGRVPHPGRHKLTGAFAVVGAHASGPEQQFVGVRACLQGLDEWAALAAFGNAAADGREVTVTHRFFDVSPATADDGSVVDFDWTFNVTGTETESATMTRRLYLEVRDRPPASWGQLDRRVLTPLATLLTLCTGRRARLLEVRLDTGTGRWVEVVGPWLQEPDTAPRLTGPDMLIPHGIIQLAHVARWLDRVDDLGPLPPVVADSVSESSRTLETEVLELTTVAEGLHRRLYEENDPELALSDVEQARNAACEAAAALGDHLGGAMKRALEHFGELSYPRRVRQLGERAEHYAPGVTGQANRWKNAVVNSRNVFAHRPKQAGFLGESDVDQHLTVLESLRWALRVILLSETGLQPETIRARIAGHEPYRYFLDRVRQWTPNIYSTADQALGGTDSR